MAVATALSTRIAARWRRFDGAGRLAGVDLARGLAVVGMLAAHMLVIAPFVPTDPATWLDVVNGRSSILFATLAGVSIALVTGGREPVQGATRLRASARIALRGAALWGVGMLLIALGVPVYVILPAYAILFPLSLPFLGLRPRTLFTIAAAIALIVPWPLAALNALPLWRTGPGEALSAALGWAYPFPLWLAFLLAGLAVGRCDLRSVPVAAGLLGAGTTLALVGYGIAALAPASGPAGVWTSAWSARAHSGGVLEAVGSGGFALAVIGACLLLCRTFLRWLAVPLRAVGAMPLTAYAVQLLLWAAVAAVVLGEADDLTGFRALEPFWPITLFIVAGSCAWTLLVGRGPLEAGVDRFVRWIVPSTDGRARVDRLEG